MLAAPYRLREPIGPTLQVVIFTPLGEGGAKDALSRLRNGFGDHLDRTDIEVVPIPHERLSASDRARLQTAD
jgi:hypothetical protein